MRDNRRGGSRGGRSSYGRGRSNQGGGRFGQRGRFSGGQRRFAPRQMHKAVCAECGEECEVPFKPTEGRPVYCRDCYSKKGDSRPPRKDFKPREKKEETVDENEIPKSYVGDDEEK